MGFYGLAKKALFEVILQLLDPLNDQITSKFYQWEQDDYNSTLFYFENILGQKRPIFTYRDNIIDKVKSLNKTDMLSGTWVSDLDHFFFSFFGFFYSP